MSLDKEEKKFANELKDKLEKAIESVKEKYGYWDYVNVKVDLYILSDSFEIADKINIIDEREKGYCNFCGKETYYFDKNRLIWLCPSCYVEVNKK